MKALVCRQFGLPHTLSLEELPDPEPGPTQVVVEVHAAGVNFPDTLIIQGKYQFRPEFPFSPGGEVAGIVRAVGAEVRHVKAGDPVIAITGWGGYAQLALAEASNVVPLPPGAPFELAATFSMAYGTSHHALADRARLQAGETLLVLGAAGGVGLAAVELGKLMGARVIAAASSADKLEVCRAHGADITIDYSREDLREAIRAATDGRGPDVIYDPVGDRYCEPALRSIAWKGRYLVVGFAAGEIPKIALNLALLKGCDICGVFWGEFVRREPRLAMANMAALFGWLREGKLRPLISARYPLARGAEALQAMIERRVTGKVVVLPRA